MHRRYGAVSDACFHCGEPLRGSQLMARIGDRSEPVCCAGCLAVAQLIAGSGLADFYRLRQSASIRPEESSLAEDLWAPYARPHIAAQYTRSQGEHDSVTLLVEGLRCSACSWLLEQVLRRTPGVVEASANAVTGRAHIVWRRDRSDLAAVLRAIAQLGYRPHPLSDDGLLALQRGERHDALKRLAVAAFGMMQVMTFAVSIYAAELAGETMDAGLFELFRLVSLLVATPVMFYAGAPVLRSAWNSVRRRSIGMDVPVGIALVLAYAASVWNTYTGHGEVYFDSVTMFIFFLTLGRFVQMSVRHRTTGVGEALARQLPAYAHRVHEQNVEDVPIAALRPGDIVLVRSGEILPVDGELIANDARLDESMLTGESRAVRRGAGERVAAGTLNVGDPLRLRATQVAAGTTLAHIVSLLRRAQAQKPALSCAADAAAGRFLRYVLLGAGLTCAAWLVIDPSRAFEATLAVLVVACPCAFAIATPAAVSTAIARLARHGVLVTKPDALEALAKVDTAVFDKTGTLTRAEVRLAGCTPLAALSPAECMRLAATLELASEHPLARAFAGAIPTSTATAVRIVPGLGVEGRIDGRLYRIGRPEFVAQIRSSSCSAGASSEDSSGAVYLGDEQHELARFTFEDTVREDAREMVETLGRLGIEPQILSGDGHERVAGIAARCGIATYAARRTPAQKLADVQALQRAGRRVAMVGDGVNDAPVLAAADVAIAMGRGTALAHASADMLLVGEQLGALPRAVDTARRTLHIARQNLLWAAIYNLGSLPLAALGYIPPWLAALGMSLSSMGVMLNATRLLPRAAAGGPAGKPTDRSGAAVGAMASQLQAGTRP